MAGLAAYYVDALEELNSLNCPVDPALFAQLIEGETRLGPEEPISTKKTLVEVSPGVHFEMAMNSGTRRSGFEVLRDIITRYRRAWAEQYLNSYLKARWDTELREAARHHSEAIAGTGKPPRAKQFAKYALTATNHWLGGNMSAFYAAIGEKSVIRPERICLMPADRAGFSTSVFKALGGQPFERRIFVANREEGHVQAEEQARHAQLVWLASSSLRFTQLEEALGRSPELKEFGTPAFANRSSALSADTDEAWERYVAVVETVRQQPKLAQHVESMPEHLADEQPSQHDVAAPPPVAVRAAPEQSGS